MQKLTVRPISTKKLDELPNSWNNEDYRAIIDSLDGDTAGISDDELRDYCYMTITDAEQEESILQVLKYTLGEKLNSGQLDNLVHNMTVDKMWEEFPSMDCHADIFRANQLLYKAFNGKVPKGDAMTVSLEVETHNDELRDLLQHKDADCLLRLIMAGSSDHAVMHRLFDDEATDGYLTDAKDILWITDVQSKADGVYQVQVTSSAYWFHDFIATEEYECKINMDVYDDLDAE